jgi:hypothetical protein
MKKFLLPGMVAVAMLGASASIATAYDDCDNDGRVSYRSSGSQRVQGYVRASGYYSRPYYGFAASYDDDDYYYSSPRRYGYVASYDNDYYYSGVGPRRYGYISYYGQRRSVRSDVRNADFSGNRGYRANESAGPRRSGAGGISTGSSRGPGRAIRGGRGGRDR